MKCKVLITGDSHVGPLNRGIQKLAEQNAVPDTLDITIRPLGAGALMKTPFFVEEDGVARMLPAEYKTNMLRLPTQGEYTVYGFSGNFHTTRILRDVNWSNIAPIAVAKDEQPVSTAFLNELFHEDQKYMLALLDVMLKSQVTVFVVEAPRAFRHQRIFERARKEVLFYIDQEYRKYIRRELEKRGIQVIAVPPGCLDEEGFMLDCYRHPDERDQHHGNAEFGEVMMREVTAFLEKTVPAESVAA